MPNLRGFFVSGQRAGVGEAAYIFKIGGVGGIAYGLIADVDGLPGRVDEFDEFGVVLSKWIVEDFADKDVLRGPR